MRVLEARRADRLLTDVGHEEVSAAPRGQLVKARVLAGRSDAFVHLPRVFTERSRRIELDPRRAGRLVDGDPPAVRMLAREGREATRCLGQDEAEFRELRSDDTKQTTHDG